MSVSVANDIVGLTVEDADVMSVSVANDVVGLSEVGAEVIDTTTEVTGGSVGPPVENGADVLVPVSIAIDTVGLLEVGGDVTGAVVVGDNVIGTEVTGEIDGINELEEAPIEGINELEGNMVLAPIVGSAVDVIGAGLGPRVSSCAAIDAGASMRCSSASAAMRGSGSIIIFIWVFLNREGFVVHFFLVVLCLV
jgi:hypothetical protein